MRNSINLLLSGFIFIIISIMTFSPRGFCADLDDWKVFSNDNSEFAINLYRQLGTEVNGNIFFSPYSVSVSLLMTWAGARGLTKKQMSETLNLSLSGENLYSTFSSFESYLDKVRESGVVELAIANSIWPEKSYKLLNSYTSLLKKYFNVSVTSLDYKSDANNSRIRINEWVGGKTQNKITEFIPANQIDASVRLVLTNAIYFQGKWENPFKEALTEEETFYVSPEVRLRVPLMLQTSSFPYIERETVQALELPYKGGDLSMLVLLPKEGTSLKELERTLTFEKLDSWRRDMKSRRVRVFLPKFRTTSMLSLAGMLSSMGMVDAFSEREADFSGIDGEPKGLYISKVLHKAFIDVDEAGTEAAATTAVIMSPKSANIGLPRATFRADRPFVFLIQETRTGSILFMGRVSDPTKVGE